VSWHALRLLLRLCWPLHLLLLLLQLLGVHAGCKLAWGHERDADVAGPEAQHILGPQHVVVVLGLQPQALAAAACRTTKPRAIPAAKVCRHTDAAAIRHLCMF
jgi:hypothetical protein